MSVSIYYSAVRAEPLSEDESAEVERIAAERAETFPFEDEESLHLYSNGSLEPGTVLAGSTKMPFEPGRLLPIVAHVLDSVTALRRAVPGTEWRVHMDDLDIEWDEAEGYSLPGMRDADLIAEMENL